MLLRREMILLSLCAASLCWHPLTAQVVLELYTDPIAFAARLGGDVMIVNFDDVDTGAIDPAPFQLDRYGASHGIIIQGEDGQYAGTTFDYPVDYAPRSLPNTYAPGPIAGEGNTTNVSFRANSDYGMVAGFGAHFIDVDFSSLDASSLTVFDISGVELATTGTLPDSGNGSQIFRGFVAIDLSTDTPIATIASALLVNGGGWPVTAPGDGVVLDDFTFSNPVPATIPEPAQFGLITMLLLAAGILLKHRAFQQ